VAFRFYRAAWEASVLAELRPSARLVCLAIADRANTDGVTWVSQETLARQTGLSERTVRTALKILEAAEIIRRTRRWKERGGGRTSDLIHLLIPSSEP